VSPNGDTPKNLNRSTGMCYLSRVGMGIFEQALPCVHAHAALLSVFDLFNTMEEDFRVEAAGLVEYMYCPEGG